MSAGRTHRTATFIVTAVFLGTACPWGCGGGGEERDDPTATASFPRPESIMEVTLSDTDGSLKTVRLPVDQLVVLFDQAVSASQAEDTLGRMIADQAGVGLRLVGRIPSLRIYQLELDNPETEPQAAVTLLDGLSEAIEGYDSVTSATYNSVYSLDIAENDDDNCDIDGRSRSAHAAVDYYQAIPVLEAIIPLLPLAPVTVGVVDSGIDLTTGQFDHIQEGGRFALASAESPAPVAADLNARRHGTAVAAIIAADNGDGVGNGIALRVLGDRLRLVVAAPVASTGDALLMSILANTKKVVTHGASIVNLSLGDHTRRNIFSSLAGARDAFLRLAQGSPQVLFVVSAPNEAGLTVDGNCAPAGLRAANILTVGGIDGYDFSVFANSAVAPGIDLAAPAVEVPTCCGPGNVRTTGTGNSFATPIATSIAAIVRSFAPAMTGAELKTFLTAEANTYPAPVAVGGRRPALLLSVGNAILRYAVPGAEVRALIDFHNTLPPDGLADSPGLMISRLFSRADFSVSGPGYARRHTQEPGDTDPSTITSATANSITGAGQVQLWFAQDNEILKVDLGSFQIGSGYPIRSSAGSRNTMLVMAGSSAGERYTGSGTTGTLTFDECEITTRSLPLDSFTIGNTEGLIAVEVSGRIEGVSALGGIATNPIQQDVTYQIEASFTKCFALSAPDPALLRMIEASCLGGYQWSP
jgi:hypothetical protein